jgi:putative copper export protein
MEPVEVTSYVLHSLFAGLWAGSVLFVVLAVLPMAREGELNASPLRSLAGTLTWVSRVSALVLLLTGSQMAAARYTGDSLAGTTGGRLVIGMVALWLVLAGTVEVGTSRLRDGTERDKVREPAREARRLFSLAGVTATLLLVVAGLLSARSAGFL